MFVSIKRVKSLTFRSTKMEMQVAVHTKTSWNVMRARPRTFSLILQQSFRNAELPYQTHDVSDKTTQANHSGYTYSYRFKRHTRASIPTDRSAHNTHDKPSLSGHNRRRKFRLSVYVEIRPSPSFAVWRRHRRCACLLVVVIKRRQLIEYTRTNAKTLKTMLH